MLTEGNKSATGENAGIDIYVRHIIADNGMQRYNASVTNGYGNLQQRMFYFNTRETVIQVFCLAEAEGSANQKNLRSVVLDPYFRNSCRVSY